MPRFALKPTQMVLLSFLLIIVAGGLLLFLPFAGAPGRYTTFLDALFTSTSAVCVTGLVVVPTWSHWSMFGQVVILCLIQIGGLGLVTFFTLFWMAMGRRITLTERMIIQTNFNQDSTQGMVSLVRRVVLVTLAAESAGALLLTLRFAFDYPFPKCIFMGVFHAISAFCNAGFDLIGDSSLIPYAGDGLINFVIMGLIIAGGLGFVVWRDIGAHLKRRLAGGRGSRLSLHTRVVLLTTLCLLAGGFILVFLFEYNDTLAGLPLHEKLLASAFQSVSPRTAGFASLNYAAMQDQTLFLTIILMFIGGSPAGTAGGIKTVTLAVLVIAVLSIVRGSKNIHAFKRSIPLFVLQKALAIILLGLFALVAGTMLLSITEHGNQSRFLSLLFECASALGTVGLSVGLTPTLSAPGKVIIILLMFIGRLGPITVAASLSMRQGRGPESVYPEERPIVG